MGLDLETPDHTTLSRRNSKVEVPPLAKKSDGPIHLVIDSTGLKMPWCTTPREAECLLLRPNSHGSMWPSGIPSAVMVFRILHPILASTLCEESPLARIAEPTIAL